MPVLDIPPFKRTKCFKGKHAKHGRIRVITKVNGLPPPSRKIVEAYAHAMHQKANRRLAIIRQRVAEHYIVRIKDTPNKGKGAFNAGNKPIPQGKDVAWFIGSIVKGDKPFPNNFYLMNLGKVLVGKRFLNLSLNGKTSLEHYKDINASYYNHSCNPNCKVVTWYPEDEISILVIQTMREIQPGEELTIHYGEDYWHTPETGHKVLKRNIPSNKMIKCLCSYPSECPNKYFLRSY